MFSVADKAIWPKIKSYYFDNGYAIIDTHIDDGIIESLSKDLYQWFENKKLPSNNVSYFAPNRLQDGWRIDSRIKSIALDKTINSLLHFMYNRLPRPFQTLNFYQGTEQPEHSDAIHFNSEPFGMMCGVWLALENINQDQGPLVFYPGSNKLPDMDFRDLGLMPKGSDFREYSVAIKQMILDHGFEPKYGLLKKGQAIIWSANLLHGGSRRLSNKTRLSQVSHYYFENCRYWRPSASYETRAYFEPSWITTYETPCKLNPISYFSKLIKRSIKE
ncbi:phytanoyl-CoA dioxygenase family protein [Neptunicella sp. SCSIO 80796]|uniref:phytanoyl-CoA dioxygenase family protein n=1 Tax=Neptunicella plasticusilytica TaxID=3117012 RepID=UPI003A4E3656